MWIMAETSVNSLLNWPMQTHGADMLRLAVIAGIDEGIEICAPVHDALLIKAPAERIDADVAHMRELMTQAGHAVCGIPVRTDATVVRWPYRFMDEREGSRAMWERITQRLLPQVEAECRLVCLAEPMRAGIVPEICRWKSPGFMLPPPSNCGPCIVFLPRN